MERIFRGILAGFAATFPMTAVMLFLRQGLPREWFKPLPPRHVTLRLASRIGLAGKLDEEGKRNLIWLSHLGYGAGAGALYASFPRRWPGPLYGAGVWAISYLGLLPALALYRPANKDPGSRNFLMITSHLVWGVFLELAFRALGRVRRNPTSPGPTPSIRSA